MSYCGPRSIPWSIFVGERGWPAPGEPMWTAEDRALALEWQAEQDLTCTGCGHPLDESTADENADAYRVRAVVCHACRAREIVAAEDQEGGVDLAGRRHVVVLSEEASRGAHRGREGAGGFGPVRARDGEVGAVD